MSKEHINTVNTDTTLEITLKYNSNNLYVPVSVNEYKTKSQPLEHIHHHRNRQFCEINHLEMYTIVQHRCHTNKTEPFTLDSQKANYAELLNSIKFSLAAMDDIIPKSPETYNYFFYEQTELTNKFLHKDSNTDIRLLELPIEQIHAKSHGPTTGFF